MIMRGIKVYNTGIAQALSKGLDISSTSKFATSMSDADISYSRSVVKSFNADTSAEIAKLINASVAAGLTPIEIKRKLSAFALDQDYRVSRFAANEAWRASEIAGLRAMTQLNDELNKIHPTGTYKTWVTQAGACPICVDYAGISIPINEQFFGGLDTPPAHVACRCKVDYSIIKKDDDPQDILTTQNEVHCRECDRFLGLTSRKEISAILKCSNTKCKALAPPLVRSTISASSQLVVEPNKQSS